MYTATFETVLLTAILAIRTMRRQHMNHAQRNQRMGALQKVLWDHMKRWGLEWQQKAVLRAVYELLMESGGDETHTDVKARLRLAEELCAEAMDERFTEHLPTPHISPEAVAGRVLQQRLHVMADDMAEAALTPWEHRAELRRSPDDDWIPF